MDGVYTLDVQVVLSVEGLHFYGSLPSVSPYRCDKGWCFCLLSSGVVVFVVISC